MRAGGSKQSVTTSWPLWSSASCPRRDMAVASAGDGHAHCTSLTQPGRPNPDSVRRSCVSQLARDPPPSVRWHTHARAAQDAHAAQARARWGALGVGYRIALGSRPRYRWSAVKAAAQSDPALRNAWIGSGDNRHRTCPCHLPRQVAPQPSVLRWEGRRRAGTVQSHPAPWPPLVARATRGAVAVRCAGNHSTPAGSLPRRHRMARIGSISSIRSVQVTGGSHR